jgi:WD40 repeat protein
VQVKELWNFKHNESILGIELADINNNGVVEIIAFTRNGKLLFLSLNGKLLHQEVISKDSPIWHLKIYDINNDGNEELILGGMDGVLRTFKCKLSYNLDKLWNHDFNSSISGILIDDINYDNIIELIGYSLDKTMRVLNSFDGSLIWGQIFEDGIGDAIVFNDGKKIIMACGNDGTVRCFNSVNGELIWFKRFSNKMRFISYLNSSKGGIILCGGDDKKLHMIEAKTKMEFKTIEFKDYVWKCITYPLGNYNKSIVSSYSFDYLDNFTEVEHINFTSKLIYIDEFLEVNWELKGYNIECLKQIEIFNKNYVLAGTTKGELIVIEEQTGSIIYNKIYYACLNMVQFFKEKKLVLCCYDDGTLNAYKLISI